MAEHVDLSHFSYLARAAHGLAIESKRLKPGSLDVASYIPLYSKLQDLTLNLAELVDAEGDLIHRTYQRFEGTPYQGDRTRAQAQAGRTLQKAAAIIGKAADPLGSAVQWLGVAVRSDHSRQQEGVFPGHPVRRALGEVTTAVYDSTDRLHQIKYHQGHAQILGPLKTMVGDDLVETLVAIEFAASEALAISPIRNAVRVGRKLAARSAAVHKRYRAAAVPISRNLELWSRPAPKAAEAA